jgi:methylglyoxal synthase
MNERPVVALVATPNFKKDHETDLRAFVFQHFYSLTKHFKVISTGNTYGFIQEFIGKLGGLREFETRLITEDFGEPLDLDKWRASIIKQFTTQQVGLEGMIEIAYELVQGRLDAVIQLSVGDDTTVRAGSAVLRREANVHGVPIAANIRTAHTFADYWKKQLRQHGDPRSLLPPRKPKDDHCALMNAADGDKVLALIAHDKQKVAMTQFVMEHSDELKRFTRILSTGHSGEIVRASLRCRGWTPDDVGRILCCNPGPEGGDVEIAAAVVKSKCRYVFFFQDPAISHPHEADIRLFEQSMLDGTKSRVRLATNAVSATLLLAALQQEEEHSARQQDTAT